LTVIDLTGAAWSKPLTIPLVIKPKTLSGSLIPYTSDHGQVSSARRRAGLSGALKFLSPWTWWLGPPF
jgi:hypothetical protein